MVSARWQRTQGGVGIGYVVRGVVLRLVRGGARVQGLRVDTVRGE